MPSSSNKKPLVIVTRKLPDAIETRLMELFETRLNADDKPLTAAQLVEAVKAADVLVPTVTDRIDSRVLSQAGPKLKLIANFGNGFDNIDVATALQVSAWSLPALAKAVRPVLAPGGAIGRTLLLRVADIMRTGDRMAHVEKGAKVLAINPTCAMMLRRVMLRPAVAARNRDRAGNCGFAIGRRGLSPKGYSKAQGARLVPCRQRGAEALCPVSAGV